MCLIKKGLQQANQGHWFPCAVAAYSIYGTGPSLTQLPGKSLFPEIVRNRPTTFGNSTFVHFPRPSTFSTHKRRLRKGFLSLFIWNRHCDWPGVSRDHRDQWALNELRFGYRLLVE